MGFLFNFQSVHNLSCFLYEAMMGATIVRVPDGMSMANVLVALWKVAPLIRPIQREDHWPYKGAETTAKVNDCFEKYYRSTKDFSKANKLPSIFVDKFAGRIIVVEFRDWPFIDVTNFDSVIGTPGSAAYAIQTMLVIPSENRPDPGDGYVFRQKKSS